jgi:hypothetical protein
VSNGDDATVTRKAHIKRLYKDDDPDTNSDIWIDVERLDELRFVTKTNFPWQERVWQFDWDSFNPDGSDLDGNEIPRKPVQDPNDSSDPNDPGANVVWVPVRAMVFVNEGSNYKWQGYKHYFINDNSNFTRETHSRRVYHYDIPANQLDDNQNPPRDPQDYLNSLGDKDKDQYLEVEILDRYWTNEMEGRDSSGNTKAGTWQEKKWLINSDTDALLSDWEGETDNDFATINPDAGPQVDPPWRLDPLQNIVNVSWLGGLAVEFGDKDQDAS